MALYKSLKQALELIGEAQANSYFIKSGKLSEALLQEAFRADFYIVCICLSGEIQLEVDGDELIIDAKQVFVAAPSTAIAFSSIAVFNP